MRPQLELLRGLLPRTTSAGTSLATTIGHAAAPAETIDAALPLGRLERAFRSPHLGCVLASEGSGDGRIGLVTRTRYFATVAGDLGFGRALLSRASVADVVDWSPLVLDADVGVVEAALTMTARPAERRYDPVLVRAADWRVAAPDDVVRALTALLAASALQDPLTGLPNAAHVELDIADALARTAGTPHRVALLLLGLEGLDRVRAVEGDDVADELVLAAAAHVRAGAPAGWDVGRCGDGELTVLGMIPGPVSAAAAAEYVDGLQTALAASFRQVQVGDVLVRLRSAAVGSGSRAPGGAAGPGDGAALLAAARRRLAPRPRLAAVRA